MKSKRGFTLIELITAMSILILITLGLTHLFSVTTQAMKQGQERVLMDKTARLILDTLEQDISQSVIRTNVPFRLRQMSQADSLYFVSTGVRRKTETMPRDTAPIRIRTIPRISSANGLIPSLHRRVAIETANGTGDTREKLIRSSDYYSEIAVNDFITAEHGLKMTKGTTEYTGVLYHIDDTDLFALSTFLNFSIHHKTLPGQPARPLFIDVQLGLITANHLRHAMRLYAHQGSGPAQEYIARHESIYNHRIFMRNQGMTWKTN